MEQKNGRKYLGMYMTLAAVSALFVMFQNFAKFEPLEQDTDELFLGGALSTALKTSGKTKAGKKMAALKDADETAERAPASTHLPESQTKTASPTKKTSTLKKPTDSP